MSFLKTKEQEAFIVCDTADLVLKDIIAEMEHPFYALSKKPDTKVRRYEHGENWIEITPSVKGLATIYDKDILIYCISKIISDIKNGNKPSQTVRIKSREFLLFSNRGTGGKDFKAFIEALDRLEGTRIRTNIVTGGETQTKGFGIIDSSDLRRENGLDGRLIWCEVKISDWIFNAIQHNEILTLSRDYFKLRKPIDRRIYELARKHCGSQREWRVTLPILFKKTGSKGEERQFKRDIMRAQTEDHLPNYSVFFENDTNTVVFKNREKLTITKTQKTDNAPNVFLSSETYAEARAYAPGADIYRLEQEWKDWIAFKKITPKNPDKHFKSFCQTWHSIRDS